LLLSLSLYLSLSLSLHLHLHLFHLASLLLFFLRSIVVSRVCGAEVDNKVVDAMLGRATVPEEALKKDATADISQLMTHPGLPPPPKNVDAMIDEQFEFSTDLMSAARYMPEFRKAARAVVRYREKLNEARQLVTQVRAALS
jgi:hypothetical protein